MKSSAAAGSASLGFESGAPYVDPVIEAYKKDVDRTLIREMLKLTPEQRLLVLERALEDAIDLREGVAGAVARAKQQSWHVVGTGSDALALTTRLPVSFPATV